MPSSRSSKISNRQWEEHRSVIERLYLQDELTLQDEDGCEGLVAYMLRVHAFDASLSQYEDRLKRWGIRKYLTQDDWITVKSLIEERSARGKKSVVYISGKALKDSQVHKGVSRPAVRNALRGNSQPISLDIQLPSYLEVRSPELLPQQEVVLQESFQAGMMPPLRLFEDAITSRDYNRLTELFTHSNGASPLGLSRFIARLEDHDLAEFVLECIDLQETAAGEFLKQAIPLDNVVLVELLLRMGINPNALFDIKPVDHTRNFEALKEYIGSLETPLIVAILCKNKHIINMLLNHRAFLNPQLDDYRTSQKDGTDELSKYVMSSYIPRFLSALEAAVQCQDMELVRDLLSKGADPYDSNALVGLIKLGHYDIVKTVIHEQGLKKHSSVNDIFPVPIEALVYDNSDVTHPLSHRADLEHLAALKMETSIIRYQYATIPDNQADNFSVVMNALGRTIHGFACQEYSLDTIRTLLHGGINKEAICLVLSNLKERSLGSNTRTFTPLNLAVFWDSGLLLNLLNEHGANINGSFNNLTKRTPLQLAAELGHLDMVSQLVRLGADVNWPPTPCKGFTALQLAAKHGFCRIAELLLENQAMVDCPAARICGRTAFEAATENGRLDMMLLLVRSGADLISSAGDKQFKRAITFAKARGGEAAIALANELRDAVRRATLAARDAAFDALLERGFA